MIERSLEHLYGMYADHAWNGRKLSRTELGGANQQGIGNRVSGFENYGAGLFNGAADVGLLRADLGGAGFKQRVASAGMVTAASGKARGWLAVKL
ncbi:MAG: hypothetical protein ACR2NN_01830 [Bryobacteraceae bacterium]